MAQTANAGCLTLAQLEELLSGEVVDERLSLHLESCPACRDQADVIRANNELMTSLSRSATDYGGAAFRAPDPGQPLARAIPGYEIVAEIHRGGQGIVYRARQLATKRTVALKVLLAGAFATTRERLRFEREIDLVAGLQYPNIVTVHDSGVTNDGRHWFAMEYIEGTALDEHVRSQRDQAASAGGPASLRAMLRLFEKICAAVSYAHQRGVIHRDLKPANILVDDRGEPHVLDFGLAKPLNPRVDAGDATVTVAGGFVGTLAYASPEQTRGDLDLVDVRTDVYALGVILYEMLTGHFPYPVTGQLADIINAVANVAPKPMRGHPSAPYRIGDEVETIVMKLLAKEPQRRYQSAEAVRQDIEHYLAGEPIDAKRDRGWYVLKKTLLRYKVQAAVAAAFVLLLSVFSVAMSVLYQRARRETEKVTQINVFLEDTLGSVEPGPGEDQVTVRAFLDEGVHWIELALGDQPQIEAAVRGIIGNGYRNLGQFEDAERQLLAALEARRELFGQRHVQVAKGLSGLGLLRRDQGRHDEARRLFEEALDIRRTRLGDRHLQVAMSLSNLALIMQDVGRPQDSQRLLREALAIRRSTLGDRHGDVAMIQFKLAQLLETGGAHAEARSLHEVALETRRAVLHEEHPDLSRSLMALGLLHLAGGDPVSAEPLLAECVKLRRQALPAGHQRTAAAQRRLGDCLAAQGRYEEAEPLLVESYRAQRANLGDSDERTGESLRSLRDLYEAWGKPQRAAGVRARVPIPDVSGPDR